MQSTIDKIDLRTSVSVTQDLQVDMFITDDYGRTALLVSKAVTIGDTIHISFNVPHGIKLSDLFTINLNLC